MCVCVCVCFCVCVCVCVCVCFCVCAFEKGRKSEAAALLAVQFRDCERLFICTVLLQSLHADISLGRDINSLEASLQSTIESTASADSDFDTQVSPAARGQQRERESVCVCVCVFVVWGHALLCWGYGLSVHLVL